MVYYSQFFTLGLAVPFFALPVTFCIFLGLVQASALSFAAPPAAAATGKNSEIPKPVSKPKASDPFADAQQVMEDARAFHKQEEALSRLRLKQDGYPVPTHAAPPPISAQSAPANFTR